MSDPIQFPRTPYKVWYKDQAGEVQKITRTPPPKLHPMMPQDVVILNQAKAEAWPEGRDYGVKSINWKNPNVLQLEKETGETTFVNYTEVSLQEKVQGRGNRGKDYDSKDDPISSRYLGWP